MQRSLCIYLIPFVDVGSLNSPVGGVRIKWQFRLLERYKQLAKKLKNAYFTTFYNPKTGVLAGWKSSDGKLHDYYFLMVNSMVVYYNLVPDDKMKGVMMTLWNRMQASFRVPVLQAA
jgi:hypothetical protein